MAASAVPRAGPSSANHVTFSSAIGGVHGAQVWTHIVTGLPALGGLGWVSVVGLALGAGIGIVLSILAVKWFIHLVV